MKFLIALLAIVTAMGLRDLIYTALTIFEARGNGEAAGRLDAMGDVVGMLYTVIGIDALNKAGFTLKGIVIICAIAFTSYNTTKWATNKLGRRPHK